MLRKAAFRLEILSFNDQDSFLDLTLTRKQLKVPWLKIVLERVSKCASRKEGLAAKSSRRRRVNVKALKRKWDRTGQERERGRRRDSRRGGAAAAAALDLLVDEKRKEDRTRERETWKKEEEERDQDHLYPPPYPD